MSVSGFCLCGFVLLALVSPALGQEAAQRRVAVRVTGAAGRSVFLDRGRGDGVQIGMTVALQPPNGPPIDVVVRAASTNSSSADLPPEADSPPLGTPGECYVEVESTDGDRAESPPKRADPTYSELPWPSSDDGFDPSGPLLSPVIGTRPERRPVDWNGRVFSSLVGSTDRSGSDGSNDFFLGRIGTRVRATNLFGQAGQIEMAFDFDRRATNLRGRDDRSDTKGRLERISYTLGDAADEPRRVQLGRFYSAFVPEVGLLDGIEGALRLEDGVSVGAFVGALPRPFPAHETGEDIAAHAFVDYRSADPTHLAANLAFQKTWHRGAADRDLILGRLSMQPAPDLTLWLHTKLDVYTSGDTIKGSGLDLTESFATLRYAPRSGHGASLSHSHFEWVETDRREFQDVPVELIRDGRVDRLTLDAWVRPLEKVRLRGRATHWDDQNGDGTSWEVSSEFDGLVDEHTWLSLSVFGIDGSFTDGYGIRTDLRRRWDEFGLRAGFTWRDLDRADTLGTPESFTSRSFRFGGDWLSGRSQVLVFGDYWFGDREDAFSLGVSLQYRI